MIGKLHHIIRSFSTQSKLVFRRATIEDAHLMTRNVIQEEWHVGPHDFPTFLEVDPNHYYMCEIDGEVAAHLGVTYFPGSHYYAGGMVTNEKYRKQGLREECGLYCMSKCDPNYTIGMDVMSNSNWYEALGFRKHWDYYFAMLDLDKLSKRSAELEDTVAQSILSEVVLDRLLEYDQSVFGTQRNTFLERWINTPGSFGWAAVDKSSNEITGYTVLKQVIRGGGTEIGLAMAPLFADNAEIAKFLINRATEECLTNPAIPKTKLEIFHPVGDNCGEGAAELMKDLDAELIRRGYRMYTKGIPPGRQTKKIYGIASPNCD